MGSQIAGIAGRKCHDFTAAVFGQYCGSAKSFDFLPNQMK